MKTSCKKNLFKAVLLGGTCRKLLAVCVGLVVVVVDSVRLYISLLFNN